LSSINTPADQGWYLTQTWITSIPPTFVTVSIPETYSSPVFVPYDSLPTTVPTYKYVSTSSLGGVIIDYTNVPSSVPATAVIAITETASLPSTLFEAVDPNWWVYDTYLTSIPPTFISVSIPETYSTPVLVNWETLPTYVSSSKYVTVSSISAVIIDYTNVPSSVNTVVFVASSAPLPRFTPVSIPSTVCERVVEQLAA